MKILNLYAGVGGNRKLWGDEHEILAVENNERIADVYSRLYPNDRISVDDAHEILLHCHQDFDFIWSSPPCQSHTQMVKVTRHQSQQRRYPDMGLYAEIVFLRHFFHGKWVVENVEPYYGVMHPDGVFVKQIGRHVFWSNFQIYAEDVPTPENFINLANMAGKVKMQEWLGIHYEENIYYDGNHCPAQILRNAVHPLIGEQILESALRGHDAAALLGKNADQLSMFT